jgi:hypothetical protein
MSEREKHPVWGLYDQLRTARLNVKYFGVKLCRVERVSFALDFILMVAAPSSAVAGLWFWNTPTGEIIWRYFGIVAALAAILKPLLSFSKKIISYSDILAGYRILEHELSSIKEQVILSGTYNKKMQDKFLRLLEKEKDLIGKDPDSMIDQRLRKKCTSEVNEELPAQGFFVPSD